MLKLTRGMRAYQKTEEAVKNRVKFVESGRNIQVFNIKMDVDEKKIRDFFSEYGSIESFTFPKRNDPQQDFFHCNILFEDKESAEKAIN